MSSPQRQHRILYVGNNYALLKLLHNAFTQIDCRIVRCPTGSISRTLLQSNINYSLLLFDDQLPDTTGLKLKHLARQLPHRQRTPIIILKKSDEHNPLVETILKTLAPHTTKPVDAKDQELKNHN
jgi:CheY-like chemotaxis protein